MIQSINSMSIISLLPFSFNGILQYKNISIKHSCESEIGNKFSRAESASYHDFVQSLAQRALI